MKSLIRYFALCFLLGQFAVAGNQEATLQEIQKQLLAALDKDIAENSAWDANQKRNALLTKQIIGDLKLDAMNEEKFRPLDQHAQPGVFSKATETLLQEFRDKARADIAQRNKKSASALTAEIRELLTRAMASSDPDEIDDVLRGIMASEQKIAQAERGVRELLPAGGSVQAHRTFVDNLRRFHEEKLSENWRNAVSILVQMDRTARSLQPLLSAAEIKGFTQKLRTDLGVVPRQDFEAVYQKHLQELLDDGNQDKLDELLVRIRKLKDLSGYSSNDVTSEGKLWQRMDMFSVFLAESIQRVRDGGIPQVSLSSWTGSSSGYPVLMSKERLEEALSKYRVKVVSDDGKVAEARLYYTSREIQDEASKLLADLLDDGNQGRLDEIYERIQLLQRYSSSGDRSGALNRLQQVSSFAQNFMQSVRRVQDGEIARVNVSQWLRSNSDYGPLMNRQELTALLKKYRVKVTDRNGAVREEPLYQDVHDVMARMKNPGDIAGELVALKAISQASSYDSGEGNIAQMVSVLGAMSDIHENVKKGDSFVLSSVLNPMGGYENAMRSVQPNPFVDSPFARQLEAFRYEVERSVLERMLPGENIAGTGERDQVMESLMKKFIEAKNYQSLWVLGRVTTHFVPQRPVISSQDMLALQNYVDGVRQQEELEQPRLATGHYQRAAAARSTLLPVAELKARLHQLKKEHPEAYEKGTDDALASEIRPYNVSPPHFMMLPPLVVPAR